MMYKILNKLIPYIFLIPAIIILTVFFFIPFFHTIILSFFDYSNNIYSPIFIKFENYLYLFKNAEFLKVIANTFIYMFIAVPILVTIPLFLAILINQNIKLANLYKILIYLPVIISIVVVAIAFKWLYNPNGILNYLLKIIHLPEINFLTDSRFALLSVIALTVFKGIGYYMMIYLSGLMTVPKELIEAAQIDGANFIKAHLNVTIPHILPTVALVAIISSISALKVFVEIYVLTKGGPMNSTKTIVYYIYERSFEYLDLGVSSAASVILLILVLLFSIFNILIFEKDKYKV